MKKTSILLLLNLAFIKFNAQTVSFYYCGQSIDLESQGFNASDNNSNYAFYEANVQEVDPQNNNQPVGSLLTYIYSNAQGVGGGPLLSSLTGLKIDKTYQIYYRVSNTSNTGPWGPIGSTCLFSTINSRYFNNCNNSNLNINTVGTLANDHNAGYNYYRFEFSLNNTFTEHTILTSNLSNKFSIELNPSNKSSQNSPTLDHVSGLQYAKVYYARVKVKKNLNDNWSTPGPGCTFTTYCPGTPTIPLTYWQMESPFSSSCLGFNGYEVILDVIRSEQMQTFVTTPTLIINPNTVSLSVGQVGNSIDFGNVANLDAQMVCASQTYAPYNSNGFTCEFLFKANKNELNSPFYLNFGGSNGFPFLNIGYHSISFSVFDVNNLPNQEYALITLLNDFPGIYSYEYFLDGNFHHFAFVCDMSSKRLQLWIDGKRPANGSPDPIYFEQVFSNMPTNAQVKIPTGFTAAGYTSKVQFDELAIYDQALSPELIYQHYIDMTKGNHYNYCTNYSVNNLPAQPTVPQCVNLLYNEKAPMSGNLFSVSASDQLKLFPLPRFKDGFTLRRNVNFNDLAVFFGVDHTQSGNYFGHVYDVNEPFEISYEMFRHWNYYYHVETPSFINSCNSNPNALYWEQAAYKLIQNANNPTYNIDKISTTTYWTSTPVSSNCYAIPASMNDALCSTTQGIAQASNINTNLLGCLTKKIDYIAENGEFYNACGNAAGNNNVTTAAIQHAVESAYKGEILNTSNYPGSSNLMNNTEYSIYGRYYRSPINSNSCEQADWNTMRSQVKMNDNKSYSTMDLYTLPSRWWHGHGGSNGLYGFLNARFAENNAGDNLCAPYVNGGYNSPNVDMRASQYLALLKAYSLIGTEYFHVAYFNVTDSLGNFSTGTNIPHDPRGYIYQFVMPSYAQAISSRFETILRTGSLEINNTLNTNPNIFIGGNRPAFVRKHPSLNLFVITGSIQRQNNCLNIVPDEDIVSTVIGGSSITFKIRRQGSTYVYDKTQTPPVFYQLDEWHESTHPYFWSKNFTIEAELFDNNANAKLNTEIPVNSQAGDFSNFTTYISYPANFAVKTDYYFEPRNQNIQCNSTNPCYKAYTVWVRARGNSQALNGLAKINVDFQDGVSGTPVQVTMPCIDNLAFKWYNFSVPQNVVGATPNTFIINASENTRNLIQITGNLTVEIDKLILSESGSGVPAEIDPNEIAQACSTSNKEIALGESSIESNDYNSYLSVSPNPTDGDLKIALNSGESQKKSIKSINVFDTQGRKVFHRKITESNSTVINLSLQNILNGFYLVEVETDNGVYKSRFILNK